MMRSLNVVVPPVLVAVMVQLVPAFRTVAVPVMMPVEVDMVKPANQQNAQVRGCPQSSQAYKQQTRTNGQSGTDTVADNGTASTARAVGGNGNACRVTRISRKTGFKNSSQ
jgi:hypothetical protein